jgi:hypothetical protein
MLELLKKLFNWVKLFLALNCLVVSVAVLIAGRGEFQKGAEKWGELLLAFGIFFLVGLLLLFWFFKTRKKLHTNRSKKIFTGPESDFYQAYPKLSRLFDGWSFNGFGSRYFTYSNKESNGSVCATKWITMAFLPVIPLYRDQINIISATEKIRIPFFISSSTLKYTLISRVSLDRNLILLTRLFYFAFFLPALVLPIVLALVFLHDLTAHFHGAQFWWVILFYFAWGIFLIFLTELFNKKWFLNRAK